LGRGPVIIAQHHNERPPKGIRAFCQRLADRCLQAYISPASEGLYPWQQRGLISAKRLLFELPEASSWFSPQNRARCKATLGLRGELNYLWVGRLIASKDPETLIRAFADFAKQNDEARLFVVSQGGDLLDNTQALITELGAERFVRLVGALPHTELETWYSASDFYISTSLREGTSYALTEAMACGCVPILSIIPSFRKMTDGMRLGLHFEAGNYHQLGAVLRKSPQHGDEQARREIRAYFEENLSFHCIARGLERIFSSLLLDQP
jgi:glycosyltransferase involved in cell wall biosynthesis